MIEFKRGIYLILFLFLSLSASADDENENELHVGWEVEHSLTDDGSELNLVASIDEGWYIYSMFIEELGGPTATELEVVYGEGFELGDLRLEKATVEEEGFDRTFEINVKKLIEEAKFTQSISYDKENPPIVGGYVVYQVCNEELCFPPTEVPFTIDLKTNESAIGELTIRSKFPEFFMSFIAEKNLVDEEAFPSISSPVSSCDNAATATNSGDKSSVWGVFLLGIFGGLIALLTPCVFPMIPLTVTFFTKRHENKAKGIFDSILYGFSIFFIYFIFALPFLIFKLPQDTLYRISTNPWLNLSFFAIFIFFALSLFGFYELTLPSKWANKTDAVSNKGGIVGIFFMAITLAIVSFSCTGPILGSLMAGSIASEGGQYKLVAGMSGFGIALGLPFALFAMFPGMLKKLPKSGSWMNTVKVGLAFLEIALAMKFLSNADLVSRWGLISYQTFLVLWIIIFLATMAYMFGFIRFPHDHKGDKINLGRKLVGTLSLGFALFLATGLFGQSMGFLSGFLPPQDHGAISDLEKGIAKAERENKPMLIDFTGWSCVNCRQVEQNIWPNPEVTKRLSEDVILVSLYADDRTKLKAPYFSDHLGRTVKTIGGKWTDFESQRFGQIAQPLYAMVTHDGQLLNDPIAFTTSVDDYISFLDCGLMTYEQLRN